MRSSPKGRLGTVLRSQTKSAECFGASSEQQVIFPKLALNTCFFPPPGSFLLNLSQICRESQEEQIVLLRWNIFCDGEKVLPTAVVALKLSTLTTKDFAPISQDFYFEILSLK